MGGNQEKGVGLKALEEALKHMPHQPGVYKMRNTEGKYLYIGKAKNLQKRVRSYSLVEKLPHRLRRMVQEISAVEFILTATEVEALLLEANLIQHHQPPYNILLKGGQAHAYLVFTQHPFPLITRQRHAKQCKAYFGPFLSYDKVKQLLKGLHEAFLLRSCSDKVFQQRTRPCLQYHIQRCSAPCVGYITQEDYHQDVQEALEFLRGHSEELRKKWTQRMMHHSQQQEYEKAGALRDRLQSLDHVQTKQTIHNLHLEEADVMAVVQGNDLTAVQLFCFRQGAHYGSEVFFFPNTEKGEEPHVLEACVLQLYSQQPPPKVLLLSHKLPQEALVREALKKKYGVHGDISYPVRGVKKDILNHAHMNGQQALDIRLRTQVEPWRRLPLYFPLSGPPQRVEIYDNSHLKGQQAFSAMVVAGPEGFRKEAYRLFAMSEGEDDYAMMRQVMLRRFRTPGQYPEPDLILVDGGKGQVSVVWDILKQCGYSHIPLVGISKGPQRKDEMFHRVDGSIFFLHEDEGVLHLVQRLRDEAHRFAIHHHRQKRRKEFLT